jgi:phenylalanyl-tRNA synthetase beta chain
MLLITDPARAVGLAGIMGGQNSEMTQATTEVLLESATFNATNTRRTAGALHLRTEASLRFEKGLNPELAIRAVRRATQLILETAGGTAAAGISDTFPAWAESTKMLFTNTRMRKVLGADFAQVQVIEVLRALGFTVDALDEDKLLVSPPYWRIDISIEEDVIEEVARTIGYDAVPERALAGQVPSTMPEPRMELREEVRDLLVQGGLQEMISYSLVSRASLEQEGSVGDGKPQPIRTANPMSREQEYLRLSLRGSLLRVAASALRHPPGNVALFEVGRVFLPRAGDLPDEREMVVGVLGGPRGDSLWDNGRDALDFYEAKGAVQVMLDRLGMQPSFVRGQDDLLHPGRTARVFANGRDVGVVGELHPITLAKFDFPIEQVALFELDLNALSAEVAWLRHRFESFSRYPGASRDLALVVDSDVPAEQLSTIIESHPLVVRSTLFDIFTGEGLDPGKKSLAYRLDLQSSEGTLNPEQLTEAVSTIVGNLEREIRATLRT